VKRKKSRPRIVLDDHGEEREGVQADVEYGYGQGAGWVNVEGRRRGGASGSGAKRSTAGVMDEARRHSVEPWPLFPTFMGSSLTVAHLPMYKD
jgi:hypothetical protein